MAQIEIDGDRVTVSFTRAEKVLGVLGDLTVPRSAVVSAALVESWREVHGWRVGMGVPGYRLVGTWRTRHSKQLVALRRGLPAVRVGLQGAKYDELLISTPNASSVMRALAGA